MSQKCPDCGREFDTERGLKTHVGLTHENEDYIPDDDLLSDLCEFASELGRTPFREEMAEDGPHTGNIYEKRFGTWGGAIERAGLESNVTYGATDDELIEELQRLASELGRSPAARHMSERGKFGENTYLRRFGSWNNALENAGLEINDRAEVEKSALIAELDRIVGEIGRAPSRSELRKLGEYSVTCYCRVFGTWRDAVRHAGYEPRPQGLKGSEHPSWKEDSERLSYGSGWEDSRQKALERDGWCCQHPGCELSNEEHIREYGVGLDVHHIDGDHRNHEPSNLITLCKICHLSKWQPMTPLRPQTASN